MSGLSPDLGERLLTLAILADTHVPDRSERLNPALIRLFRSARPAVILHAGDVSVPSVLYQLEEIAPVQAVRGNRDFLALSNLPASLVLEFGGVRLGLTHGHGRWRDYFSDKLRTALSGNQEQRFRTRASAAFSSLPVVIFGHSHRPWQEWVNGQFIFNPGSACCPDRENLFPSAGLLHIYAGGQVAPEIIYFD